MNADGGQRALLAAHEVYFSQPEAPIGVDGIQWQYDILTTPSRMLALGVRHLRIEFLDGSTSHVERTVVKYRQLLQG